MAMDETRAVARLPHLDIEIRHRKLPEEGAELLAVTLRATPDLDAAAALFNPFRFTDPTALMAAWWRLNPWFAWLELARPGAARPLAGPARDER